MKKKKIGIIGASGYTGAELMRIITNHRYVEVTYATAERFSDIPVGELYPDITEYGIMTYSRYNRREALENAEVFFSAVPHGHAMKIIADLYDDSECIIDLSADFRFSTPDEYERQYGEHTEKELNEKAVYSMPEINGERVKGEKLISNPGCYPTASILALAPLVKNSGMEIESIIIDAKSGVTGAGHTPTENVHFCSVNEDIKPYKTGNHRHGPEIEEKLSEISGRDICVLFSPHLAPYDRGILATCYVKIRNESSEEEIRKVFEQCYEGKEFVKIAQKERMPGVKQVRGTNFCQIGIAYIESSKTIVVASAIDNLIKGASGQAVQNMNLALGYEESEGLSTRSMFP